MSLLDRGDWPETTGQDADGNGHRWGRMAIAPILIRKVELFGRFHVLEHPFKPRSVPVQQNTENHDKGFEVEKRCKKEGGCTVGHTLPWAWQSSAFHDRYLKTRIPTNVNKGAAYKTLQIYLCPEYVCSRVQKPALSPEETKQQWQAVLGSYLQVTKYRHYILYPFFDFMIRHSADFCLQHIIDVQREELRWTAAIAKYRN